MKKLVLNTNSPDLSNQLEFFIKQTLHAEYKGYSKIIKYFVGITILVVILITLTDSNSFIVTKVMGIVVVALCWLFAAFLFLQRLYKLDKLQKWKRKVLSEQATSAQNFEFSIGIIYKLLMLLIVGLCVLVFLSYGWICFATLTDRPGINGNLYWYYDMPKFVFAGYMFLVCASAAYISARLIYFSYWTLNLIKVRRTFIYFLIFVTLLILAEIYLNARYVGK